MIALAVQIRILFLALLVGVAAYVLLRLWQRVRLDPRLRAQLSGMSTRLLLVYLLRRAMPVLLRLLRLFR